MHRQQRLSFNNMICRVIASMIVDRTYQEQYLWQDFLHLMQNRVSIYLTPNMLYKCLIASCPHPFPKKFQAGLGQNRKYYLDLPTRDDMRAHLMKSNYQDVREILVHNLVMDKNGDWRKPNQFITDRLDDLVPKWPKDLDHEY